ncbi:MAG: cytidine deaminase [Anaerotignum sp.]|nr:cytidine deaminase [Anaerotignum sp.]
MRPSKQKYYLGIAEQVAARSTCIRRQYGAIIVKDDRIISTGYNGSARGQENCSDIGRCWREENNIPHGQQYEKCRAVHAEANAIINGDPADMIGAKLYLAGFENGHPLAEARPCEMCQRMIKNAQISAVVTYGGVLDD